MGYLCHAPFEGSFGLLQLSVELIEGRGDFGGLSFGGRFGGLVVFMLLDVGRFVRPLGLLVEIEGDLEFGLIV